MRNPKNQERKTKVDFVYDSAGGAAAAFFGVAFFLGVAAFFFGTALAAGADDFVTRPDLVLVKTVAFSVTAGAWFNC